MTSSSARLAGLNEKPDGWISCLLLLLSLPCGEETCEHLFLFQLCTSSCFNSCMFHNGEETCCLRDASEKVFQCRDQRSNDFSCSFFLNPRQTTFVLPLEYRTPQNKLVQVLLSGSQNGTNASPKAQPCLVPAVSSSSLFFFHTLF